MIGGTGASGTTNLPATTAAGTPFNGTASVTFTGNFSFAPLRVLATNDHGVTGTSAVINVYVFIAPPPPPPPPVLPVINIYPLIGEGAEVSAASGLPLWPASFRVTHNFPATATVSFLFAIGGTAKENVDYTLSSAGTIGGGLFGRWFTFPAGTTEAVIFVNPIDDLLIESTENVTLSLYTPPYIGFNEGGFNGWDPGTFGFYYGTNPTATVTILDNDTAPPPFPLVTITATKPTGSETTDGSDPAIFTVTRTSGPTDVPLTVNYALTIPPKQTIYVTEVRPTMAQNGVDFPLLPGTVTIPAGATSVDIVVVPTYDLLFEGPELLQITLRPSVPVWPAPGGYVIDDHIVADATIQDAVLPAGTPIVTLSVTDALAFHDAVPGRTASFAVTRTGGLTQSLDVFYTVGGTATAGVDYTALPGVVTIPAGSAAATILIDPPTALSTSEIESVTITLDQPLGINPPPYAAFVPANRPRTLGISIYNHIPPRPVPVASYFNPKTYSVIHYPPKNTYRTTTFFHVSVSLPAPPVLAPVPAAVAPAVAPPQVWTVEASPDLVNWDAIGTTDPSGEYGDFVDVNAGNFGQRFYRFRPLP